MHYTTSDASACVSAGSLEVHEQRNYDGEQLTLFDAQGEWTLNFFLFASQFKLSLNLQSGSSVCFFCFRVMILKKFFWKDFYFQ